MNPIDVLRECCTYHAPVIILSVETEAVCYHARLASLSSQSTTLEVSEQTMPLYQGTLCFVSFVYKGDPQAFFSTVLEYRENPLPEPSRLVLEIPSRIMEIEARGGVSCAIPSDAI